MRFSKLIILMSSLLLLNSQTAVSDQRLNIGVKAIGAGWEGDNGSSSDEFKSSEGGQLGFNISYKNNDFYTGLSVQGGEYNFGGNAPDQFTTSSRVSTSNVKVEQTDLDLVVGYYFWPQVSLFLDIKAVGNRWKNDNYKQAFGGLGVGATTVIPINEKWTLFGSFGFIGNGEVQDENENKVGDGKSSALEAGAVLTLNDRNHLNMGVKFRNYDLEYLDNSSQEYSINAIFFGYTHVFNFK